MADIRLICCDIDGTLVRNDKTLSEESIRWIRAVCDECGVHFVIVTGRMYSAIKPYYEALGIEGPASCINGCLLFDSEGRIISDHRLPVPVCEAILPVARESGAEMLAIAGDTWFTESQEGYLYASKLPLYRQESVLCSFDETLSSAAMNKLLFMSGERDRLAMLEDGIRSLFSNPDEVTYYQGPDFLEIMPGGISKGTGIDDLGAWYGLDPSRIMAIGDDINDIEMIGKAGIGIAMGNALEQVKAVSDYVTLANEEDGVAYAIRHFFFEDREV